MWQCGFWPRRRAGGFEPPETPGGSTKGHRGEGGLGVSVLAVLWSGAMHAIQAPEPPLSCPRLAPRILVGIARSGVTPGAPKGADSAKGLTDALSCSSAWSYCFPTIDSLNAAPTMSMQAREHVRWTSRPISRASSNHQSFKSIHSSKTRLQDESTSLLSLNQVLAQSQSQSSPI